MMCHINFGLPSSHLHFMTLAYIFAGRMFRFTNNGVDTHSDTKRLGSAGPPAYQSCQAVRGCVNRLGTRIPNLKDELQKPF